MNLSRLCIYLMALVLLLTACNLTGTPEEPSTPLPAFITATPRNTATLTFTPAPVETTAPTLEPTAAPTSTPIATLPADPMGTLLDGGSGAYIRSVPGALGDIMGLLRGSAQFRIEGRTADNRWLQISLVDGGGGWLLASDVQTDVSVEALAVTGQAERDTEYVVVVQMDTENLRLRQSPYEYADILLTMGGLTPLEVIGRLADDSWLQVVTGGGLQGWVSAEYVEAPFDFAQIPAVAAPAPPVVAAPPTAGAQVAWASEFVEEARVAESRGGVRLRQLPVDGSILFNLNALTPLEVNGRTTDNAWVLVKIPEGYTGWVAAEFVEFSIDTATIPVIINPQPEAIPNIPVPENAPNIVSGVTGGARAIYIRGQQLGNHSNVFSTVGDSITATPYFLREFRYSHNLRDYGYLLPVLHRFSQDSFYNVPRTSKPGWLSWTPLSPDMAPAECGGESPLVCEYRLSRPSVALIMLGTNDARSLIDPAEYRANMTRIVEISINMGVIPVLSTMPPRNDFNDYVLQYNDIVRSLAAAYDVPLWDFYNVVTTLNNRGLSEDGVHLSIPPNAPASTTDFTTENLTYGTTMRNLTALQVLYDLMNNVMY